MNELPVHLRYVLTRRQRLIPHLAIWSVMGLPLLGFFALFLVASIAKSAWFLAGALVTGWLVRGFVVGLADVLFHPVRHMDIMIEPLGIGYLAGGERWYVHMDGVLSIRHFVDDIWTISHHNGTVINVPIEAMPNACVEHIRAAIDGKWTYLCAFADEHRKRPDARPKQ